MECKTKGQLDLKSAIHEGEILKKKLYAEIRCSNVFSPARESSQLSDQSETIYVELRHHQFGFFWRESQKSFQRGRK